MDTVAPVYAADSWAADACHRRVDEVCMPATKALP